MKTSLRYVNKSNDKNNSNVVIFQKPTNPDWNMETIAWMIIENCGTDSYNTFDYEYDLEVNATDSYGNFTSYMSANPGDLIEMTLDHSGNSLTKDSGKSSVPTEIQLVNHLSLGSIDACCYRSGKLVCKKSNVVPQEQAIFEFKPFIYVGVISDVHEGETMNSAIVNENNQAFSLHGIKSADLVMYGGGSGTESKAYTFQLENVVKL